MVVELHCSVKYSKLYLKICFFSWVVEYISSSLGIKWAKFALIWCIQTRAALNRFYRFQFSIYVFINMRKWNFISSSGKFTRLFTIKIDCAQFNLLWSLYGKDFYDWILLTSSSNPLNGSAWKIHTYPLPTSIFFPEFQPL